MPPHTHLSVQIATEDLSILQVFHDQVYQMALSWFRHLPQSYQQYLHSQHGAIPGPDHSLQVSAAVGVRQMYQCGVEGSVCICVCLSVWKCAQVFMNVPVSVSMPVSECQ